MGGLSSSTLNYELLTTLSAAKSREAGNFELIPHTLYPFFSVKVLTGYRQGNVIFSQNF